MSDAELDDQIEETIVAAYGDDEHPSAFACIHCSTRPPAPSWAGGARVGLRATVRSSTGRWTVALVDITDDPVPHPEVAMTVAAYRRWLGDGLE